jgi:hypothetical protein
MKKVSIIAFVVIFLGVVGFFAFYGDRKPGVVINDFESCIVAGNPAMESYPRQCRDEISGKMYVEVIEMWMDNGVILMQNEETGEYGCFGCGEFLCIDPAPIMKQVEENEDLYCNEEFELVEDGEVVNKGEILEVGSGEIV